MNRSSPPLTPSYGRVTKLDRIRCLFHKHRRETPITVRDAWRSWRKLHEFQDTYDAFRVNVSRLSGRGSEQHLYSIETRPYGPYLYLINFKGLRYIYHKGYISKEDENRARKWLSFTVQDVMKPSRVNRIIESTKHGWRSWER